MHDYPSTYHTQASRENYNLVNQSHFLQKVIDTRSFEHIEVMPVVIDFDRDNIVRLLYGLRSVDCQRKV